MTTGRKQRQIFDEGRFMNRPYKTEVGRGG